MQIRQLYFKCENMSQCTIEFKVNGKTCRVDTSIPRDTSLNAYIRYELCLVGTKAMCREGGCGACIVMVKARRYPSGELEVFSVNSCLVLVFSCNDWEITTIEGVGNRVQGYSDVQKRIAAFNGTQCGYCTPGWVMQLTRYQSQSKYCPWCLSKTDVPIKDRCAYLALAIKR